MKNPVRVKICGITNRDDALASIDAGADALGFNLFPGSKRHVRIEEVEAWVTGLKTLRVAVMVNPPIEEIRRAQRIFDVVQLHGQESSELCREAAASGVVWKAFPLRENLDVTPFEAETLVVDSCVPGAFGGTGRLIDLEEAARFVRAVAGRRVWLSGGLNPENVGAAVEMARPFGVDVASGVEAAGNSRLKDMRLVRAFIAAARGA